MLRKIYKYTHLCPALLLLGFVQAASAQEAAGTSTEPTAKLQNPDKMAIEFDAYRKNIDDLFYITLRSNSDPHYGLNTMIIDLNRKLAEDPENPDTLISLGHIYRILGEPGEANSLYEKALAIDPQSPYLYGFSAMMLLAMGDSEGALAQLNQAVRTNPTDSYAWFVRGKTLIMLNDVDTASMSLEKVLELDPDNQEAATVLSLLYQERGDVSEGERLLEGMYEKHPTSQVVRYHLGVVYFATGRPEKTISLWEELFFEGIRDIRFLKNLAAAYLRGGNPAKAEKIVDYLLFSKPRDPNIRFLRAEAYRMTRQWEQAEREYRGLMAEYPGYIAAALGLAQTLEDQGEAEEAVEILKEAAGRFSSQDEQAHLDALLADNHLPSGDR
ncbi:MAG: tetratricopeptide repeat protein [Candidatus Omnitrophota bacterium]|nr:tetratricopeptide repeat protein [Candidatus Omnitrophota bacterium]